MRSLRDRLASLQPASSSNRQQPRTIIPIDAVVSGSVRSNRSGEFFLTDDLSSEPDIHGLLAQMAGGSAPCSLIDERTSLDPTTMLFLDTETTGLAGGTGTHAFLVGVGYFDGEQFRVNQFFMRDLSEERALLEDLLDLLGRFRVLVTFNGRSFDWPLIESRLVLHGHRYQPRFRHLDLLHPARRVWKHRLPSCALTSLEQSLFGLARTGDVPGFLIPQIYFDYLRHQDARPLGPVFYHNREDILTMVRLTNLLMRAEQSPADTLQHPEDMVGMAQHLLRQGETRRGMIALASAVEDERLPGWLRSKAESELCRCLKRAGRLPEAVPIWEQMCNRASRNPVIDIHPFEELAKYYEHRQRDFIAAERVVERALTMLELRGQSHGRELLLHRAARLRRKTLRTRSRPGLC